MDLHKPEALRMDTNIRIESEVGTLRTVLLHRPGRELESLTPQYLDSMLFEDIPFLDQMQVEHDQFAQLLKSQGCTVRYIEELLETVLVSEDIRQSVIAYLLESSQLFSPALKQSIGEYLGMLSVNQLATCCIGGLLKSAVNSEVQHSSLSYHIRDAYPYYISPLPNLYFTRDPATVVGSSVAVHTMKNESRRRESWLFSLIAQHHPLFATRRVFTDYSHGNSIEGGDILMIDRGCAAVGSSARTGTWAIEAFARLMTRPIECGGEGLDEVLVIQIPYTRAYMHLDTVFTMVDRDAFSIYGKIAPLLKVFSIKSGPKDDLIIREERSLKSTLERVLAIPSVRLIPSGGPDRIVAEREQWNDSTNTLAIAPGKVITYRRNIISNETLEHHGITVLPIPGSELVRGRGGPRCMSMPLFREAL